MTTTSLIPIFANTISSAVDHEQPISAIDTVDIKEIIRQQFAIKISADVPLIFSKSIEEISSNFYIVKNNVNASLEKIISLPFETRTFENTVLDYDLTLAYFRMYGNMISTVAMTHPDNEMRKKAEIVFKEWADCVVDQFDTNKNIYKSFKEYATLNCECLNEERSYYLTNAILAFERAGLNLDARKLIELKELQKQITSVAIEFQTNISQYMPTLSVKKDELQSVNEDFIHRLTVVKGEYILKCDYPTYFQIMTNCSIESTRKKYLNMFNNRAHPKNIKILNDLINYRDSLAKLLGYSSYAAYDIAPEMAQTVETVENFLDTLSSASYANVKKHWNVLLNELPDSVTLTTEGKIKSWDVAYLADQYIKKHLDVDQEEIAEYFPMEKTIRNLLNVYEQFFSIKFNVINQSNSYWDDSIQTIEVRNEGVNSSLIGYVLLDLFPRENKYSHCCCNCIIPPIRLGQSQTFEPALAVVIANFSKSTDEKPSLLKHHEVKTFFHEFGHSLHALFGRAELPTKAAYNTKIDFIEMPSQLLEEWMWERDILKMVSHHYQRGGPLPDSIIDGLIKTRTLLDAAHVTTAGNSDHQATEVLFAKLSLALFKEGKNKDIDKLDREAYAESPQIVTHDPTQHYLYTFGHLAGYGAKYYSYPWAKEMALKIFNYIKCHGGLLNPKIGQRYLSKIIGRGGSTDPNILITDFLQDEIL